MEIISKETFNTTDVQASTVGVSRELNVLVNGMNLAKYVGTYSSGWSYALQYHLLDHLGSRQATLNSNITELIIQSTRVLVDRKLVMNTAIPGRRRIR